MEPDTAFTRRVCAVLLADVSGFSKLMGEDDERTARAVHHVQAIAQEIVGEHNGRAEPVAGDALFATFDSVVTAVQAAVALQRRIAAERFEGRPAGQPLRIRIGVHLGDVLLRDGRAFGDVINIAARLEALARPGTICISEGVYRQVRNTMEEQLVDLGRRRLKNISDPVHAYLIVPNGAAPRPALRRGALRSGAVAAALVATGVAAVVAWRHLAPSTPARAPRSEAVSPPTKKSVAVLPFVNMSGDSADEYLSDGMTEEIITALSKVSGLRVAARTSSFAFKGKNEDIETIGDRLRVGTVLEGSVRKAGNKLRITTQLVNVADGFHLWSEDYDRDLADVFAIESDVAQRVAEALEVTLLAAERQRLEQKPTENLEAHQLYLNGRFYSSKLTLHGLNKGAEYFRQAIAIDPNYALAYNGLAYYYLMATDWMLAPTDAMPKAKEAATRALAIDDTLAEAHAFLGLAYVWFDWNWTGSEREFRRAIELDPNSAVARDFYGAYYLTAVGRADQAIAECERALQIDPLSLEANVLLGASLFFARRYDQAVEQARRTVDMEPNFWFGHYELGLTYAQMGKLPESIAEFRTAAQLEDRIAETAGLLGWAYGIAGQREEALKVLDELREREQRAYVDPSDVAFVYIGLGDKDQAFEWLDKAYVEHSYVLAWLRAHPLFDSLRSDPRFAALLKKVRLDK